jgi:hypothetical protein
LQQLMRYQAFQPSAGLTFSTNNNHNYYYLCKKSSPHVFNSFYYLTFSKYSRSFIIFIQFLLCFNCNTFWSIFRTIQILYIFFPYPKGLSMVSYFLSSGLFHVYSFVFLFLNHVFITTKSCCLQKLMSIFPLSFLLPSPKDPTTLSVDPSPMMLLKSPITIAFA